MTNKFKIYHLYTGKGWKSTKPFTMEEYSSATDNEVYGLVNPNDNDYIPRLDGVAKLVQFTGLFDKYGNEIYEGDIVINLLNRSINCPHCNEPFTKNTPIVIEWDNHKSGWKKPFLDWGQEYEILGNIYENPELL